MVHRTLLLLTSLALFACAKSQPGPTEPGPSEPAPTAEQPPVDEPAAERPGLTAAECEAQGGRVVGDIGDGAIHRPDYTCPDGGQPPIGSITAEPGGPMGVEGAVCCPHAG